MTGGKRAALIEDVDCSGCGVKQLRAVSGVYRNGRSRFINPESKQVWHHKLCPKCHQTRAAKNGRSQGAKNGH